MSSGEIQHLTMISFGTSNGGDIIEDADANANHDHNGGGAGFACDRRDRGVTHHYTITVNVSDGGDDEDVAANSLQQQQPKHVAIVDDVAEKNANAGAALMNGGQGRGHGKQQQVPHSSQQQHPRRRRRPQNFSFDSSSFWDNAPRLVPRDLPYHQSKNEFNVRNHYGKNKWKLLWNFYNYDWFHVILRWPTLLSLLLFVAVWTSLILIFAGIYIRVDALNPEEDCGMNVDGSSTITFHTAFAFSLETCTTVGYGLPGSSGAFFNNCPAVQITIYFQMLISMIFNAFLLAFLFARFSRSETRAYQVLFTEKAIIRRERDGRFIFECKVYDADSRHPVVEAHVRMYVVHCCSSRNYIPMRTLIPNDDLGSMLLTSIPTKIMHHVDAYSPLLPPNVRQRKQNALESYGLSLREVDSYTGNRDGAPCPVCGEVYGTPERLLKHIKYNQLTERHDNVPVEGSHQELKTGDVEGGMLSQLEEQVQEGIMSSTPGLTYESIQQNFAQRNMEIVVVVEGIDPLISGTFQAIQSYRREDIVYGGDFATVFTEDNVVDLDAFHNIVDAKDSGIGHELVDAAAGGGVLVFGMDLQRRRPRRVPAAQGGCT